MLFSAFHLVALVCSIFFYKCWSIWRQMKSLPPGPFSLPFIGSLCLYFKTKRFPLLADQLSKQYGEIMTVWVKSRPQVVLSSMDAVRAAFVDNQHDFASRPNSVPFDLFNRGLGGVFGEKYNAKWKANKKLVARAIRSIVDTSHVERSVVDGMSEVLAELETKVGNPVNLYSYSSNVFYNALNNFCFGESYKLNDPEFLQFVKLSVELGQYWDASQYVDTLPFTKYLPMSLIKRFPHVNKLVPGMEESYQLMKAKVNRHEEKKRHENPRKVLDILDALFEQKELMKSEGEIVQTESFVILISEIFSAGTDTSSFTLLWFLLFMILNQDVQEKCYKQIEEVCGKRPPKLSDRHQLGILEASLLETMRLRPIVSMNMSHSCDQESKLMGYTVPSGTELTINTLALHNDPSVYPNPNCFDPGHFLTGDGFVSRPQSFFTFGAGRRACLGENLAKNDLFLIAVIFLQKFKFSPVPGVEYSDEQNELVESFSIPPTYEVILELRNSQTELKG